MVECWHKVLESIRSSWLVVSPVSLSWTERIKSLLHSGRQTSQTLINISEDVLILKFLNCLELDMRKAFNSLCRFSWIAAQSQFMFRTR